MRVIHSAVVAVADQNILHGSHRELLAFSIIVAKKTL